MKIIKFKMDDREPISNLLISPLVDGLCLEKIRLKVGDYVCDELGLCVERKQIDDLCSSIMDGRIETQVKKMNEKYEECWVIIVGKMENRTSDIHDNCVMGKVLSLIIKYGVRVMWVEDEFQFLWCLRNIAGKLQEMNEMKGGEEDEI